MSLIALIDSCVFSGSSSNPTVSHIRIGILGLLYSLISSVTGLPDPVAAKSSLNIAFKSVLFPVPVIPATIMLAIGISSVSISLKPFVFVSLI